MDRFRLKERRKSLGLTLQDVADGLKLTKATVQKYESGYIKDVDTERLQELADILKCSPAYLMGWEDNKTLNSPQVTEDYTTFPVIGDIAAGYDMIANEDWTGDMVDIPNAYLKGRKKDDYFVLRVIGDSMYPLYHDNDIVLILKQPTLNYSGEIGAILYNDEFVTLKKIEYPNGKNWLNLIPINPELKPKRIENEELNHCRILGIPKLLIREIQ